MNIMISIMCMALTTYLIRMLPLTLMKKKIKNPFMLSFLYYVPVVVLTCMTFPAVLTCTDSILSASIATILALLLAYNGKGLVSVAIAGVVCVFIIERFIF